MTATNEGRLCWGIYRELAHSPGRETDDALILQAVARRLSGDGFDVELKSTEDLPGSGDGEPPSFVFVMCERGDALDRLAVWEASGACVINAVSGIRNTYRDRTLPLLEAAGVSLPRSALVRTTETALLGPAGGERALAGLWVKRGDVHNTEAGDVLRAGTPAEVIAALGAFSRRGIGTALLQEHAEGDLVKFYGVGSDAASGEASWFEWFYHRDQVLLRHPFDTARLRAIARRAAAALGLEIWGGDAIVSASGDILLIDLNAWPSFALYLERAAQHIAAHLAARFRKHVRTGVAE
ncbi:MAG: hypothetical protein ABJC61_10420 [Acidobacteriota bacterium]